MGMDNVEILGAQAYFGSIERCARRRFQRRRIEPQRLFANGAKASVVHASRLERG